MDLISETGCGYQDNIIISCISNAIENELFE